MDRSRANSKPQASEQPSSAPPTPRTCPWCGSDDTRFFKRGLTGPTDERDQFIVCNACGNMTYEIITISGRDMRLAKFRPGDTYRDQQRKTKYTIVRVLKVGLNEHLLYVKPVVPADEDRRRGPSRSRNDTNT